MADLEPGQSRRLGKHQATNQYVQRRLNYNFLNPGRSIMKSFLSAIAMTVGLVATQASAQGVDLTGRWQCVALCVAPTGAFAFITQNGWQLNMLSEAGIPSRAWINYPGRVWVESANEGAIYAPDGFTLHFDRGTIWQRAPEAPPPPRRK